MSVWALVAIPGTAVLLIGLLSLSAFVEEHLLSPESLMGAAIRSRSGDLDHTEAFVTRQLDAIINRPPA